MMFLETKSLKQLQFFFFFRAKASVRTFFLGKQGFGLIDYVILKALKLVVP